MPRSTPYRLLTPAAALVCSLSTSSCFPEQEPTPAVDGPGMWMPRQMSNSAIQKELAAMKVANAKDAYTNIDGYPLGAVVNVDGCSGSFVSDQGLLVTNQHCIRKELEAASRAGEDLLTNGFLAEDMAQERELDQFLISLTTASTDVTETMLEGVADDLPLDKREKILERRQDKLEDACEREDPEASCEVVSFYEGNRFELVKTLEFPHVRLVYAPHESIGMFGGQIDNWNWPRHTGDFAFLRVVDAKGKPYRPKHHLRVSTQDLDPQDPVIVAGYPYRSFRTRPSFVAAKALFQGRPFLRDRSKRLMDALTQAVGEDKDLVASQRARLMSLSNRLIYSQGSIDNLGNSIAEIFRFEIWELLFWLEANPEQKARFGDKLQACTDVLAGVQEDGANQAYRLRQGTIRLRRESQLLSRAGKIVRIAQARAKGEETTAKDIERFERYLSRTQPSYARVLDQAAVRAYLGLLLDDGAHDRLRAIMGLEASMQMTPKLLDTFAQELYADPQVESVEQALELFSNASLEDLEKSQDPLIQTALRLEPIYKKARSADADERDQFEELYRGYRQLVMARDRVDGLLRPANANATLRISYGRVTTMAAADPEDAPQPAMTTASQMLAKHTGSYPFNLRSDLQAALKAGDFGRYLDPELKDLPVNFLSNLDTSGGNSGSPTLNAEGELVGLAFDSPYETLGSDWLFEAETSHAIHVDIRFVLWLMDTVDPAHRLLEEMGLKTAGQSTDGARFSVTY